MIRTPTTANLRSGFSLIEVLVVMAIIGILLALLLPAIGGARRRSFKAREMNDIKNVGHAWMLYGNSNNDAALPGFLEPAVQEKPVQGVSRGWGVRYKFPDTSAIPINAANLAGPWTWRLLSYLSWDHGVVHSHLGEAQSDTFSLVSEGKGVAYEPAFGYNALYLGGWWAMHSVGGVQTPYYRYYTDCGLAAPKRALSIPQGISQIFRPSDMTVFCASTNYAATGFFSRLPSTTAGYHMVAPPMIGKNEQWRFNKSDPTGGVEILAEGACAPLARYTGSIAIMSADGHVEQQGFNFLQDMRKWVNSAEAFEYQHDVCGSN